MGVGIGALGGIRGSAAAAAALRIAGIPYQILNLLYNVHVFFA